MKKIYVIAALHGDELFGLKIIAHLRATPDTRIVTCIAHPEAIAKRSRFLDADLNRSFGEDAPVSRETAIAARISADIRAHQPDLILDLHTSRGDVGKVAILAKKSPTLISIAQHLGMQQAVVMPPDIVCAALIGQFPHHAVSLEFGRTYRSDKLAQLVAKCIKKLLTTDVLQTNLPTYSVTHTIKNNEAPHEVLYNYRFNKTLGGYPFLVGKNTYAHMRGFLAEKHQ